MGTWPDGSAKTWADGTPRSFNNGFTHGLGNRPHGYVPGAQVKPTDPRNRKRGPRSDLAFGDRGGTMPGYGRDYDTQGYAATPSRSRIASHNTKRKVA